MTYLASVINPGPVDDIRQDNAHRVGAPNHLEGSGETLMVSTPTTSGHVPDRVTVEAVRTRLNGQAHRFLTASKAGLSVSMAALAELVAEIVTECTDHVVAERDALAEDLAWELNAIRTGREVVA
jgi:hypothetical protein